MYRVRGDKQGSYTTARKLSENMIKTVVLDLPPNLEGVEGA